MSAVGQVSPGIAVVSTFGPSDWWMLVSIVVLLIGSILLAVAETTLTQTTVVKARSLVDEGRSGASRLLAVITDLERYLNSVLLVVLIFQTTQAILVGVLADRHLGAWGLVVATTLNITVVFVLAEAAPKTWSLQNPERAALLAAPLVQAVGSLPPIRLAAKGLIGLTNIVLPGKGLQKGPWVSEEEILALADAAVAGSVLLDDERDLIESIIDFGDTVAREIMVPRTDMVSMAATFPVTDMVEVAILNGLSRFPVYGENIDDVIGVVYAKDLVRAERDGRGHEAVAHLMRPPVVVPETKRVAELLKEMQARSTHMAIVIDEYGGTAGLVTLEDLIEELVGDISDEFDRPERLHERLADGSVLVFDPSINVDDLNDEFDLTLPEGDWDSVGGMAFSLLGRVPEVGDRVDVPGATLVVEGMVGRRIARLRVEAADTSASESTSR